MWGANSFGCSFPQICRTLPTHGQCRHHLGLHLQKGAAAQAEFQKIRDYYGVIGNQPFGLQPRPSLPVSPVGIQSPARDDPTENPAHYLTLLEELHDTGVLSDAEYNESKTRLLESLR